MKRWSLVYAILFAAYLASQAGGFIEGDKAPWFAALANWGPIILAVLLLTVTYRAEEGRSELSTALVDAQAAVAQIATERTQLTQLQELGDRLKADITALREEFRSSDVLLHGKVLFYQQKYRDAASLFEEAVRTDRKNPHNRYWLGLALLRDRRPGDALEHLAVAADSLEDPDVYQALGEAEFRLRMTEPAEQHLEKALTLGSRNREAILMLLAKVQVTSSPAKAKATLERLVNENPYNGSAVIELAEIQISEGSYDDAISVCDKAISLNSQNWGVYPLRAEARLMRNAPKDVDLARADLETARAGNPRDYNIYRVGGQDLVKRALSTPDREAQERLLDEAAELYARGLERIPGGFKALLYSAQSFVYLALNNPEKVEDSARKAVEANPDHINNHLMLCAALMANRRWPAVKRAAQKGHGTAGRAGRSYLRTYDILAGIFSGERIADLRPDMRELAQELRAASSLVADRREWVYIRPATWETLCPGEAEKKLAGLLISLMDDVTARAEVAERLEALT